MLALSLTIALLAPGDLPQQESTATWHSGYAADDFGDVVTYESALPEANSSLLVRSQNAKYSIAWQTAHVPADFDSDSISFVWLFGMDANPEQHRFELRLDGKPVLDFHNPISSETPTWERVGPSGVRLQFHPTLIDRHGDVFGFSLLTVPREMVTAGKALHLEVVGESASSMIWYMTFRHAPKANARVFAQNALLRGDDNPWQRVLVEVVHLGAPTPATLETSWGLKRKVILKLGANHFELAHNEVSESVEESVSLLADDGTSYSLRCTVKPVRPWTIQLVQHTHTDLGYTRPQTEILPDHLRYIDYALDYCDLTDDYPDDAKFRWTCEAAWPVREYLRYRPESQIKRLRQRITEGRLELTALFANMTELLDERGCAASLEPIREMRRHGLPVVTAMQDDVNGIAWTFADLLPELGVKYLNMGEHGHRALIPFDVPTAFWWESPSGARLLAWRPDHYNTGNFWGLHSGRMATIEPPLFRYLLGLEEGGYPHDQIAVQYSGVFLDNAPPGIVANDFIRRWNERFVWPHLRSATVSELPRAFEQADIDLPVWRAAWPDWWADGLGSAPRELAATRITQDTLTAVDGLLAMAALRASSPSEALLDRVAHAREQLIIYGEHTYGAAESISDPGSENTQVQWAEKSSFVWDAVKETAILQEAAFGLLQEELPRCDVPTISVFNTLSWPRSGIAKVFVDKELLPPGRAFRILDGQDQVVPAQIWKAQHDGNWWAIFVKDLPPFGWQSYRLELLDGEDSSGRQLSAEPQLENDFYRLLVDPDRGGVVSLFDKQLQSELVDVETEWALGQLLHEQLGNRWQLERLRLDDYQRTGIVGLDLEPGVHGPLWSSVFLRGEVAIAPQAGGVEIEIRLYHQEKKVEFRYRLKKRRETQPEGLYALFPFDLPDFNLAYESLGGMVNPETEQLPRTSTDWQSAQRFITLANQEARITMSSPEILLHQFGDFNLGKFQQQASVAKPHVYSWLLNNYWVTNFLASQEGELFWSQALTSGPNGIASESARFGWKHQMPLLTRVLPPSPHPQDLPPASSLLSFQGAEVILIGAHLIPGNQLLLHLRESAGVSGELTILDANGQPLPLRLADALGQPLLTMDGSSASVSVDALAVLHLVISAQ
jgi:alpha-mannosidase